MFGMTAMIDGRKTRQRRREPDVEASFADAETLYDLVLNGNPRYRLYVHRIKIGLIRMTVTDRHQAIGQKEGFEGCCVRELFTYQRLTMDAKLSSLLHHTDPRSYCRSLVTAWNCQDPDGPISLDCTPTVRVAHVPNQPPLDLYGKTA